VWQLMKKITLILFLGIYTVSIFGIGTRAFIAAGAWPLRFSNANSCASIDKDLVEKLKYLCCEKMLVKEKTEKRKH